MSQRMPPRRQRGFTLAEAIIVIVVLGVLGGIVAVFIRAPIQGYADSVVRAELTDEADLALRRIARDLRLALPNSLRRNGSAIEFLMTKNGGRYLAAEDGIAAPVLDFLDPANVSFTVLGAKRSFDSVAEGDYVVVHNLGQDIVPSDAWRFGAADSNIARICRKTPTLVDEIADQPVPVITMGDQDCKPFNPFAAQSPPMPSPTQRFHVVSGPVAYYCAPGPDGLPALWRAWGYAIGPVSGLPPAGATTALVATRVATCERLFDTSSAASQRSGLVILRLELMSRNATAPTVTLVHQVHLDNTP